ncbi:MAG: hypothetical protein K0R69_1207 [Clostridia bacterium]|nr:hypothetical protein [Clostridia bacterium]
MNNASIDMLMPKVQDLKSDRAGVKASDRKLKDSDNNFDSQLAKIKSKDTKMVKSIIKEDIEAKDILVKKSIDVKEIKDIKDIKDKEVLDNTILSLIQGVLQIPVEEIKQILEQMGISETDLLNQDTFKEFLTQAYPSLNENELLFNEEALKDISKLFSKLEQIKVLIGIGQNDILVERLVVQDKVLQTTTTQINGETESEQMQGEVTAQNVAGAGQTSVLSNQNMIKEMHLNEEPAEVNLSEEGLLNFKQLDLGLTTPIQAFNSIIHTKSWGMQESGINSSMSRSIQDTSLMNQLISKIDITALENHKEITMELSPKELGNLSIKLTETNGFLVANIRVDNDKTKELLLNEIAQLKQMLESQGLSVGEVKVDIRQNQHQSEMEKQKQKSVKRIQELIDKHLGEEQEESMQVDGDTGELIETEVNYMV